MKPEKRLLIADLLDEERNARQEAILLSGGRILRRKRWRRLALHSLGMAVALAVVAAVLMQRITPHRTPARSAVPAVEEPNQVRYLTDDELLALFPDDTPVGLAVVDGKKRLIFPRPGDEERFVIPFNSAN